MPIGVHTSIKDGLAGAIEEALKLGCECVQFFSHNPRSWTIRRPVKEEVERFKYRKAQAALEPVMIHSSYLINIASPDDNMYEKSIGLLCREIEMAQRLDVHYLILHPGSSGRMEKKRGISRAIEAIKEARKRAGGDVKILIENTAGSGTQLGRTLEDIACILDGTYNHNTGFCFDTAHGFSAGYSIRNASEVADLAELMDKTGLAGRLEVVHLNDSKVDCGSLVDRHEHIGKGRIGSEGLRAFVNFPLFRAKPFILETPKRRGMRDDVMNLNRVKEMIKR